MAPGRPQTRLPHVESQLLPWVVLFLGLFLAVAVWVLLAQGLAFGGQFTLSTMLVAYGLAIGPVAYWYVRDATPFWALFPAARFSFPRRLARGVAAGSLAHLLWLLLPLVAWPVVFHRHQVWVVWDVVYYHLPKAADLIQKGHMWNLALPYGQYPIGWESLLALLLGLHGHALGLGVLSFLMVVWWLLAWWALLCQRVALPASLAGGIVGLLASLFAGLGSVLLLGVGKNDVFASALVLTGLWHAWQPAAFHRRGMLLALATAWAVKPWAGVVLLGVWFMQGRQLPLRQRFLHGGLAVLTGSLWLLRNLILMGRPTSPIGWELQQRAVLFAMMHRAFWQHFAPLFLLLTATVLFFSWWAWRRPPWRDDVRLYLVLYGVFLVTPAVVQPGPRPTIQWRFALTLLAWLGVLMARWGVELAGSFGRRWRGAGSRMAARLSAWLSGLVLLACFLGIDAYMLEMWRFEPKAAHIIEDPFLDPPSSSKYRSVFAYIDAQVHGAIIEPQGPFPLPFYYLYDSRFSNQGARPGHFPAGLPQVVPQPQPTHKLFCSVHRMSRGYFVVHDPAAVREKRARWYREGHRILYFDPACVLAAR